MLSFLPVLAMKQAYQHRVIWMFFILKDPTSNEHSTYSNEYQVETKYCSLNSELLENYCEETCMPYSSS